MGYDIKKIRNVAVVGPLGSGKTSLLESMLFTMGVIPQKGAVESENTVSDYDPDETRKRISLNSAVATCEYQGYKFNFIDTPGSNDYLNDSKAAMLGADSVVLVIDAQKGIEVNVHRLWQYAKEHKLPVTIFVNKLDVSDTDYFETVKAITDNLDGKTAPVYTPIGKGASMNGLVDLIEEKAYIWKDHNKPVAEAVDIPDSEKKSVEDNKSKLHESTAELDDALLEKYLEGEEITKDELIQNLTKGYKSDSIALIMGGSGKNNIGTKCLIDTLLKFAPSPDERAPIVCEDVTSGEKWECKVQGEKLFLVYVFKTISDPYAGKISMFRVFSGQVLGDDTFYNANLHSTERFGRVFTLLGKKQTPVAELNCGEIGAIAKLKETQTGHTLIPTASSGRPFMIFPLKFPAPIYSVAITPKTKNDENKIGNCLARLKEEDPFFTISIEPHTHKTVIGGMGQTHVELILERLKSRFNLELETTPPKIPYRETITFKAEAQGKHKKQTGGHGQFGDVWLRLEPNKGAGFVFASEVVGGSVPKQYIPAVEKGVTEIMNQGILIAHPIEDVKVTLYFGSYHPVDSSELSFKLAARKSFRTAYEKANPVILEPLLNVEITAPDTYTGDIIGDLNMRRGRVMDIDTKGKLQVIKAQIPMAEAVSYSPILTSITKGQGSFVAEFSHYEELPAMLKEKIVTECNELLESLKEEN